MGIPPLEGSLAVLVVALTVTRCFATTVSKSQDTNLAWSREVLSQTPTLAQSLGKMDVVKCEVCLAIFHNFNNRTTSDDPTKQSFSMVGGEFCKQQYQQRAMHELCKEELAAITCEETPTWKLKFDANNYPGVEDQEARTVHNEHWCQRVRLCPSIGRKPPGTAYLGNKGFLHPGEADIVRSKGLKVYDDNYHPVIPEPPQDDGAKGPGKVALPHAANVDLSGGGRGSKWANTIDAAATRAGWPDPLRAGSDGEQPQSTPQPTTISSQLGQSEDKMPSPPSKPFPTPSPYLAVRGSRAGIYMDYPPDAKAPAVKNALLAHSGVPDSRANVRTRWDGTGVNLPDPKPSVDVLDVTTVSSSGSNIPTSDPRYPPAFSGSDFSVGVKAKDDIVRKQSLRWNQATPVVLSPSNAQRLGGDGGGTTRSQPQSQSQPQSRAGPGGTLPGGSMDHFGTPCVLTSSPMWGHTRAYREATDLNPTHQPGKAPHGIAIVSNGS